ncbi:MAG: phosphoenolpyruvate kinase [Myxococcales bacterium]|nr:phosphoenolpyruvate kinase [Myxococcales bacterium]
MKTTLDDATLQQRLTALQPAHSTFAEHYPGPPADRQPVHTVYGGAHLFKAGTARRLGQLARDHVKQHAPDAPTFGRALGMPHGLWETVHARTHHKLEHEPVEDFRIDFEDGFGVRPDDEEDATAVRAATEVAQGAATGELPPFLGIRIKALTPELQARSLRTLDLFMTTLLDQTQGVLPPGFAVTLPKVQYPDQVSLLVEVLGELEEAWDLDSGALRLELMVETPQCIVDAAGRVALPGLVQAAGARCRGAHFGTYDFTASMGITAAHQTMDHPVCTFAKHMMQASLAQTGVWLSDGATNVMPVGDDDDAVHRVWRLSYAHIDHSLRGGFYQGWDLHPGQLPVRFAACYAFFLEHHAAAAERLRNFVAAASKATLAGEVFDDAATGQGLLNTCLRALNCGAITERELLADTGLTSEQLQTRSFAQIIATM